MVLGTQLFLAGFLEIILRKNEKSGIRYKNEVNFFNKFIFREFLDCTIPSPDSSGITPRRIKDCNE
jgi:hypothetical protein